MSNGANGFLPLGTLPRGPPCGFTFVNRTQQRVRGLLCEQQLHLRLWVWMKTVALPTTRNTWWRESWRVVVNFLSAAWFNYVQHTGLSLVNYELPEKQGFHPVIHHTQTRGVTRISTWVCYLLSCKRRLNRILHTFSHYLGNSVLIDSKYRGRMLKNGGSAPFYVTNNHEGHG